MPDIHVNASVRFGRGFGGASRSASFNGVSFGDVGTDKLTEHGCEAGTRDAVIGAS